MIKNPVCIKPMKQEIITFLVYVFIISILQKKIKTVYNVRMSEHNYEDVWKYALEQIKQQYIKSGKETEFKLWFNMNYVEDTISTITVSVASEFLWRIISANY